MKMVRNKLLSVHLNFFFVWLYCFLLTIEVLLEPETKFKVVKIKRPDERDTTYTYVHVKVLPNDLIINNEVKAFSKKMPKSLPGCWPKKKRPQEGQEPPRVNRN